MNVCRPWSSGQVSILPLLLRDSFDKYNIAVWPFFFFQHFEFIIPPSASLQGFHRKSVSHLQEALLWVVGGLFFPMIAILLAFDSGRLDWTCAGFVLGESLTSKMCIFFCHPSFSLSLSLSLQQRPSGSRPAKPTTEPYMIISSFEFDKFGAIMPSNEFSSCSLFLRFHDACIGLEVRVQRLK